MKMGESCSQWFIVIKKCLPPEKDILSFMLVVVCGCGELKIGIKTVFSYFEQLRRQKLPPIFWCVLVWVDSLHTSVNNRFLLTFPFFPASLCICLSSFHTFSFSLFIFYISFLVYFRSSFIVPFLYYVTYFSFFLLPFEAF